MQRRHPRGAPVRPCSACACASPARTEADKHAQQHSLYKPARQQGQPVALMSGVHVVIAAIPSTLRHDCLRDPPLDVIPLARPLQYLPSMTTRVTGAIIFQVIPHSSDDLSSRILSPTGTGVPAGDGASARGRPVSQVLDEQTLKTGPQTLRRAGHPLITRTSMPCSSPRST